MREGVKKGAEKSEEKVEIFLLTEIWCRGSAGMSLPQSALRTLFVRGSHGECDVVAVVSPSVSVADTICQRES